MPSSCASKQSPAVTGFWWRESFSSGAEIEGRKIGCKYENPTRRFMFSRPAIGQSTSKRSKPPVSLNTDAVAPCLSKAASSSARRLGNISHQVFGSPLMGSPNRPVAGGLGRDRRTVRPAGSMARRAARHVVMLRVIWLVWMVWLIRVAVAWHGDFLSLDECTSRTRIGIKSRFAPYAFGLFNRASPKMDRGTFYAG